MEIFWLGMIITGNVLLVLWLLRWLKKISPLETNYKIILLALSMVIAFLIPNLVYVVERRHTTLSSLGITLLMVACCHGLGRHYKKVVFPVILIFLIACQGTAWNQVVACRILRSVFDAVQEYEPQMQSYENIIFDQYSFANHIPYTWGDKKTNVLESYWAMQVFTPWSTASMFSLYAPQKHLYISRQALEEQETSFKVPLSEQESILLPKAKTFLVNFDKVYGGSYSHGNRNKF